MSEKEPQFALHCREVPLISMSSWPPSTWPTCTACGCNFDVDYFTAGNVVVLKPVEAPPVSFMSRIDFSDGERYIRTGFVCESCHAKTRQRLF